MFTSEVGTVLDPDNLADRVLAPACAEAESMGRASTFRHTVASRLFAAGRNAKQVQCWLGHHSPSFTIDTYVHLLNADDVGGPLVNPRPEAEGSTRDRRQKCTLSAHMGHTTGRHSRVGVVSGNEH